VIDLGDRRLVVIPTPGHSPGSSCFLEPDAGLLFTGDTAYAGHLNVQLERSQWVRYVSSTERLATLPASIRAVLPGHFVTPQPPEILVALRDAVRFLARTPAGPAPGAPDARGGEGDPAGARHQPQRVQEREGTAQGQVAE